MLTGIHFLLTYTCNLECDHCFVYSGPNAKGTFTLNRIREVFDEIPKIGTIEWVYFEGGEPFLFYPLMLEGIKIAHDMGFKTGIVTNAYWAISEEDAELWLRPLCELEILDLSISDDSFHYEDERDNPAKRALGAAKKLGIPVNTIFVNIRILKLKIVKNKPRIFNHKQSQLLCNFPYSIEEICNYTFKNKKILQMWIYHPHSMF